MTCQIFDLDTRSVAMGVAWLTDVIGCHGKAALDVCYGTRLMKFVKASVIRAAPQRVFAFHELPDAFERLIPPWEEIEIMQRAEISQIGSRAIFKVRILGPIRQRWVAEHTCYDPPHVFEDVQVEGPWKYWRHRHLVEPHDAGSFLRDVIEYSPPLGRLGELAINLLFSGKLEKTFDFRHEVTRRWAEESDRDPGSPH